MAKKYAVVIVGGGPAGIFASLELSDAGIDVLLLDKGREIDARSCPIQKGSDRCILCSPCHLVSGFGGAGAFSDGKLTLSTEVGGRLKELTGLDQAKMLVDYIDTFYLKFGAQQKVYGIGEKVAELEHQATLAGL
ncbi:MAG: FAD-dependent monooxygenase, partial [Dehalococcoidia bacterium]|nr:FAD-dependent monooxygenase [Dehalococcoidia bacterium]